MDQITADAKSTEKKGVLRGFRRSTGVGAIPGSLDRGPEPIPEKCRITRISFNLENADEEVIDTVGELNEDVPAERIYWFRVEGVADSHTLRDLGEAFGLHPLALEDVVNTHQRCKVEDYGDHVFIVIRLPVYAADGNLTTEQVSLFLGDGFVVSIHEGCNALESVRDRILWARGRIREMKADYVAYTILDTVIDNYFPVIEEIGNRLNTIDEALEVGFDHNHRYDIRNVRSDLLLLRKTIWPQREALGALLRNDCPHIQESTRTWLRDCYDHTIQLMDVTETYRELCADLRDFHLADVSYRNNEVMKTLTIIATLFMPLSFVAGFYGMNFHYMPELSWRYGYPAVIVLMGLIASGFFLFFRRKGWIGQP
jgi:magnesium transporter